MPTGSVGSETLDRPDTRFLDLWIKGLTSDRANFNKTQSIHLPPHGVSATSKSGFNRVEANVVAFRLLATVCIKTRMLMKKILLIAGTAAALVLAGCDKGGTSDQYGTSSGNGTSSNSLQNGNSGSSSSGAGGANSSGGAGGSDSTRGGAGH
jgi:uncharacterized membrane protein YgcG